MSGLPTQHELNLLEARTIGGLQLVLAAEVSSAFTQLEKLRQVNKLAQEMHLLTDEAFRGFARRLLMRQVLLVEQITLIETINVFNGYAFIDVVYSIASDVITISDMTISDGCGPPKTPTRRSMAGNGELRGSEASRRCGTHVDAGESPDDGPGTARNRFVSIGDGEMSLASLFALGIGNLAEICLDPAVGRGTLLMACDHHHRPADVLITEVDDEEACSRDLAAWSVVGEELTFHAVGIGSLAACGLANLWPSLESYVDARAHGFVVAGVPGQRGGHVRSSDILVDKLDGLDACCHYQVPRIVADRGIAIETPTTPFLAAHRDTSIQMRGTLGATPASPPLEVDRLLASLWPALGAHDAQTHGSSAAEDLARPVDGVLIEVGGENAYPRDLLAEIATGDDVTFEAPITRTLAARRDVSIWAVGELDFGMTTLPVMETGYAPASLRPELAAVPPYGLVAFVGAAEESEVWSDDLARGPSRVNAAITPDRTVARPKVGGSVDGLLHRCHTAVRSNARDVSLS